jgi:hypothetical protein
MENATGERIRNRWLSVPIIATITRLLCRELTLQNEYIRQENKILKSKIKKRIVFTDDERRTLVEAALAMGRDLMEQVVTIIKPKTILAWQRKLEKQKWDYSDRRKNNPGRPQIAQDIEQLVVAGWPVKTNGAMHGFKVSLKSLISQSLKPVLLIS